MGGLRLVLILAGLLLGANLRAAEGRFGPEFTFTFDGMVPAEKKQEFFRHLRYHLIKFQPEAARFQIEIDLAETGTSTFTSPNGWSFKVTEDPGVLEVTMDPMTVAEFRKFKSDIQDAVFASAAAVGLYPWDFLGGGHINVDIGIFGGSLLLARNFVVDFWSHNELAMGIFNYDPLNAVSLSLYRFEHIEKIREVIARSDAGEYGEGTQAIERFFAALNKVLRAGTSYFGDGKKEKATDLNFGHVGRIEVRSVRPQKNMDVWLNQIELIDARINNHLAPMTEPLLLKFEVPPQFPLNFNRGPLSHLLSPPVQPKRALRAFHRYILESKLDWKHHTDYTWPAWKMTHLAEFECEKVLETQKRTALTPLTNFQH